jgi:phage gp36-like protein
MAAYATEADIVRLHGQRFLDDLADRDGNGDTDGPSVDLALELASSEIDSYVSVRYPTPLLTVPGLVRSAAINIAVYQLASDGLGRTEDIRKRYEDAIAWLKLVAKGSANLGVPALDQGAVEGGSDWKVATAIFGSNSR